MFVHTNRDFSPKMKNRAGRQDYSSATTTASGMRFSMGTRQDQHLVPIEEIRTEDEVALKEIGTALRAKKAKKRDFTKKARFR